MTFLSIAVDTAAGADPVAAAVAGVPAAAAAVSALPPRADHNKILYFVVFLFFLKEDIIQIRATFVISAFENRFIVVSQHPEDL